MREAIRGITWKTVKAPVVGTAATAKPGSLVTHSGGYRATTTRPKPQPTYEQLRLGELSERRVVPMNSLDSLDRVLVLRQILRGETVHHPDPDNANDAEDMRLLALRDIPQYSASHRGKDYSLVLATQGRK